MIKFASQPAGGWQREPAAISLVAAFLASYLFQVTRQKPALVGHC
jgi:hypothetical protein